MPRDDWRRLAHYVRARRNELGWPTAKLFARDARLTPQTVSVLENGKKVSPNTLSRLEIMFGWKPGSARAILEGGEPDLIDAPPEPDQDGPELRDDVERQLWALKNATEQERRSMIALHRGMSEQDRESQRRPNRTA